MRFQPHDYQQAAIDFVTGHPRCALWLDMGLGKTVVTLTAASRLVLDEFEVSRVLVIAPLRVARDTWPDEVAKWDHLAGLDVACAVGSAAQRRSALERGALVTTVNRENVPWLVGQVGRSWPWDMVVVDESSSFKNPQSKRFKALKSVLPQISRMVHLTGTPAAGSLMDLWAPYRLLDGGQRLHRFIGHYRAELFKPDKTNGAQVYSWKPRPGAREVIQERISDITLSMRALDHLDLPQVTFTRVPVAMPPAAVTAYRRLRQQMLLETTGGVVDAVNAATLAGKLMQVASGAVYVDDEGESGERRTVSLHDAKIEALRDLVEAASGSPVLVAYWFRCDRDRILSAFEGAVDLRSSDQMRTWNEGRVPVGLIHPASAGHGLNLQHGGHHLVWFTVPWSLELYQQTNARLHRQGQTHPVSVHHLIATGTIDERVMALLDDRNTAQEALIDAVKAEITHRRPLEQAA